MIGVQNGMLVLTNGWRRMDTSTIKKCRVRILDQNLNPSTDEILASSHDSLLNHYAYTVGQVAGDQHLGH